MKKLVIFFCLCLVGAGVQAQTTLAANREVWGTWTLAGSPYLVQGTVTVPEGKKLVIEPGVKVLFRGGQERGQKTAVGSLVVRGSLVAKGNAQQPILFSSANGEEPWGVLLLTETSRRNHLRHCIIEKAGNLDYANLAFYGLSFYKAQGKVDHCLIRQNEGYGMVCSLASTPTVRHSLLAHNRGYGLGCNAGQPRLVQVVVTANEGAFLGQNGAVVHLKNCQVVNNGQSGVSGVRLVNQNSWVEE
jgi:hypothetical protein